MVVIVPNPNQIAELVRAQKGFIKNANSTSESTNERTSTQAFEVPFFRRIHTPHIPLYCDASVGVCAPTLKNHIFCQAMPLWIFLPFFDNQLSGDEKNKKDELKEVAAKITLVEIEEPHICFSENLQKAILRCQVSVAEAGGTHQAELILCQSAKVVNHTPASECAETEIFLTQPQSALQSNSTLQTPPTPQSNSAPHSPFPMQLKIFRVANAVKPDEYSFAITDFVWKKI